METYTVRDKDGTMLMRLVGQPAQDIIDKLDGEWRTYQPEDGKRTVAYVLDRDSVWTSENRIGAFQIYLWAGTKVIKDSK